MHIHMYIHTCAYTRTYTYVCTYIHACTRTRMHTFIQCAGKAVLRLQLSSAQQSESTARRQLHESDMAMGAMCERVAMMHSEAERRTREVTACTHAHAHMRIYM